MKKKTVKTTRRKDAATVWWDKFVKRCKYVGLRFAWFVLGVVSALVYVSWR
jgi:hypothetical protein